MSGAKQKYGAELQALYNNGLQANDIINGLVTALDGPCRVYFEYVCNEIVLRMNTEDSHLVVCGEALFTLRDYLNKHLPPEQLDQIDFAGMIERAESYGYSLQCNCESVTQGRSWSAAVKLVMGHLRELIAAAQNPESEASDA